jgi:hypothetical protein
MPELQVRDTPEGQFVETVIAAQGQLERLQNRRQTLQKMKATLERGYYVFAAPVGYRYEKVEGHGRMLVRDEPLASIITEALEGYASGEISEKIANCGRPLRSFDETLRTSLDFLANPCNLWTSERLEHKKSVLKLAFADRLTYVRNEGFRTPDLALPFKVLADLKSSPPPEPEYPYHDRSIRVTSCGRICIGTRKITRSSPARSSGSARSTTRSGWSASSTMT